MRRTFTYLLAASIALSGSTIGFTGASAAVPRVSAPAAVETGVPIEQVDRRGSRHYKWKKHSRSRGHDRHYSYRHRDRHRSYNRHYSKRSHYRHYSHRRHNDGFPLVAGIVGLAIGAAVANSYSAPRYYGGSNSDYCARKYRSWDPYSQTYLGYDGRRHACRIP